MKKTTLVRTFALILALSMLLALAACKPSADPGASDNPDTQSQTPAGDPTKDVQEPGGLTKSDETLTVMLAAEPATLTGLTGISDQEACVVEYALSDRLFDFNNETGELSPSLAAGYEAIDETHYRITLRDGIHYADGTPVTAADVLYTIKNHSEGNQDWTTGIDCANCVVESDTSLVLAYTKYVPGWEVGLAESVAGIYSEAAVEAVGGLSATERTAPVGCGRYNFSEWKSGEYIMLERNENYWDENYTGYYKYIKLMWASDSASRLLAVKSGDADVAETIAASEVATLANDPTANAAVFKLSTTFNLYFNCSKGVFTDPKVREAVMYMIDSDGINQLVNLGQGEVVQGFIPRQLSYYHDYYENGKHPYDPEKGKQLLADAGYANGFEIECIVLKANLAAATVVQEALRNAGITMNITPMEPASYVPEARAGNYDITIGNNSNGYVSPDNFKLINPEMKDAVIGGCKLDDPAMTEILKRATSSDPDTAEQGWYDVIEYIFENTCLVGLYNKVACHAVSSEVEGLKLIKRDYINITELRPAA